MAWPDDQKQKLRTLWNRGLSAGEIAGRMPEYSRNAIIGQAHRLGLSSRPSPIKPKRSVTLNPGPRDCQWPHGDPKQPGFHFCGAPVFEHRPYCPTHLVKSRRKVYAPRQTEGEAA